MLVEVAYLVEMDFQLGCFQLLSDQVVHIFGGVSEVVVELTDLVYYSDRVGQTRG